VFHLEEIKKNIVGKLTELVSPPPTSLTPLLGQCPPKQPQKYPDEVCSRPFIISKKSAS